LKGGIRLIQFRPDALDDEAFAEKTRRLLALTRSAGASLILNRRVDLALLTGADGVQLGKSGIPVSEARSALGPGRLIGYSAHDPEEAVLAQDASADFITYSPIFPTTSHSKPRDIVGVENLRMMLNSKVIRIPVFPLGGIGLEQVKSLKAAGIRRAAVVTSITEAPDVESASRLLLEALEND